MKDITLSLAIIPFLTACGSTTSDNAVKGFIPGTYVRSCNKQIYENTSVGGNDTLHIEKQTQAGSETFPR